MSIKNKKMSCVKVKVNLLDGQRRELDAQEQFLFDEHIRNCASCKHELELVYEMRNWLQNDLAPNPGVAMSTRFYETLAELERAEKSSRNSWYSQFVDFRLNWWGRWEMQVAFTIFVLLSGITAGYLWRGAGIPSDSVDGKVELMSQQIQEMREVMMLSLLNNPSAPERLEAVSLSTDLPEANDRVIDALLTTLNHDSNINVRLAALDALTGFAEMPHVREGLIQSLSHQEFPLVQIALADVMLRLGERRSVEPLRQLLRDKDLQQIVRSKVEECIKVLS